MWKSIRASSPPSRERREETAPSSEIAPRPWVARAGAGARALAVSVVVISVWELVAGSLMDPHLGRLLWLVPAIAAAEAWISSVRSTYDSASPAPRSAPTGKGAGWRRAAVWIARLGSALVIVATWNTLKTLLELAWIEIRPPAANPHPWSTRLTFWVVILLAGIALWRPWSRRRATDR